MLKIVFGFTINNSNNDKNSANITYHKKYTTLKGIYFSKRHSAYINAFDSIV